MGGSRRAQKAGTKWCRGVGVEVGKGTWLGGSCGLRGGGVREKNGAVSDSIAYLTSLVPRYPLDAERKGASAGGLRTFSSRTKSLTSRLFTACKQVTTLNLAISENSLYWLINMQHAPHRYAMNIG